MTNINKIASQKFGLGYYFLSRCLFLLLIAPAIVWSQDFSDLQVSLPGVENGAAEWGDFDNDGDLDILLTGSGLTRIYRQDQGKFVAWSDSFPGLYNCAAVWADYDGDTNLDFALAGQTDSLALTQIYQNQNGSFRNSQIALPGLGESALAWIDYDNDGDMDLLLTGVRDSLEYSRIYQNDDGAFNEAAVLLPGIKSGALSVGDYDNDGDADLLMAGNAKPEPVSEIFRNDGGKFRIHNLEHIWCFQSTVAWADYDNDGDLDALIAGIDWWDFFRVTRIFKNHNHTFSVANISLAGIYDGSGTWGDVDNDGDLDLLLTGNGASELYRSDAGQLVEIATAIIGVSNSSSSWGDFDNDGDLDLLITGKYAAAPIAKIYQNNCRRANVRPKCPEKLSATVNKHSVLLQWAIASDTETPEKALTYNVRVGTAPDLGDVVAPLAFGADSRFDGRRKVVAMGNTSHNCQWQLKNLAPGTYYWSVQTIDQTYAGSPFAPEQTFTIGLGGVVSKIP